MRWCLRRREMLTWVRAWSLWGRRVENVPVGLCGVRASSNRTGKVWMVRDEQEDGVWKKKDGPLIFDAPRGGFLPEREGGEAVVKEGEEGNEEAGVVGDDGSQEMVSADQVDVIGEDVDEEVERRERDVEDMDAEEEERWEKFLVEEREAVVLPEEERTRLEQVESFRFGTHEVIGFWDYDGICKDIEGKDIQPFEVTVSRLKRVLGQFGHIRGIWTFGHVDLDEEKVEALIDDRRQLLRRMMWLKELPPRENRTVEPVEEEPYDPRFQILDVNPDSFFKDRSWEVVYLTKIPVHCGICDSQNKKEKKKMSDVLRHFVSRHAPEMNERAKEQLENDFRPFNHWWNDQDLVSKYMYALSCVGIRRSDPKMNLLHKRWYVRALGLRPGFVPPGQPVNLSIDSTMRRSLYEYDQRARGFRRGKIRGPPAIVLASDERGQLIATVKELKARFPEMIFIVIRPNAREKPLHWADYNFDWDDVRQGLLDPVQYTEEQKQKAFWEESQLDALRIQRGARRSTQGQQHRFQNKKRWTKKQKKYYLGENVTRR